MAALLEPTAALAPLVISSGPSSAHSTSSAPSLPLPASSPCSPSVASPSSSLPYDLPCPAAVLLHSNPTSPLLNSRGSTSGSFDPCQGSPDHTRCHFRSQEMLQAVNLKPGEARWECRFEEGGGLELVAPKLGRSEGVETENEDGKAIRERRGEPDEADEKTPRSTSPAVVSSQTITFDREDTG